MTRLFHTEDIISNLKNELNSTFKEITLISAFTKLDALKFIDSFLLESVKNKRLLVRFQLSDILGGSTDFEIFEYCKNNSWSIYVNLHLHSKIYIFDSKRFILGSANATLSGLGLKKNSNIESMVRGELTIDELNKINSFFNQSTKLNDQIIEKLTVHLERAKLFTEIHGDTPYLEWEDEILSDMVTKFDLLWTTDFFFSPSPFQLNDHDLGLLELDSISVNKLELLKARIKKAKCYKWLKSVIKEKDEIYFGELSALLHNALIDDPRPFRKDVKILLNNLINWIVELNIDEFIIDQPNYSVRIRLKK